MRKNIIFLVVYTLFFLTIFLVIEGIFFTKKDVATIEDTYLEKSKSVLTGELNTPLSEEEKLRFSKVFETEKKKLKEKILVQKAIKEKKIQDPVIEEGTPFNQMKLALTYVPLELKDKLNAGEGPLKDFIISPKIDPKVYFLGLELYEKINDVRGKFKDKAIKLFGVLSLPQDELFSVFTHEFGHYIDLYYLEETFSGDESDGFYDISWESTKVLKKGAKQGDFVSGYAMTNKYEDFAETFIYYALHNGQFYSLALKNDVLLKKYLFLKENVYKDDSFVNTDFSTEKTIQPYYRDITKIPFNLEKTLQYLKK